MRFKIFVPGGGLLSARRHAHTHKGKKGEQDPASVFDQVGIAGQFTEFKMIKRIAIEQCIEVTGTGRLPHHIDRGLEHLYIWLTVCSKACSQAFDGSAKLIDSCDILFAEMDDPRTPP